VVSGDSFSNKAFTMNKRISAANLAYIHDFCKQAEAFLNTHSSDLYKIDGISLLELSILKAKAQIAAEYAIDTLHGVQFEVQEDKHGK
jgi:hypothetical protein